MSEWITATEASRLYGIGSAVVHRLASSGQWPKRKERQSVKGDDREVVLFRRQDLDRFRESDRFDRFRNALSLVEWADSLAEWPTDEEIEERTTEVYRYKDIVSVLENRVYRKRPALQRVTPCAV